MVCKTLQQLGVSIGDAGHDLLEQTRVAVDSKVRLRQVDLDAAPGVPRAIGHASSIEKATDTPTERPMTLMSPSSMANTEGQRRTGGAWQLRVAINASSPSHPPE